MKNVDITFEYYYNTFCQGKKGIIPVEMFEDYIFRGRDEVLSLCNEESAEGFLEPLKLCICDVAEAIYRGEKDGGLKSETIDGYAVTYGDRAPLGKTVRRIVLRRLGNTGLLFAGV